MSAQPRSEPVTIDQRVYDLYDEYCHGRIDRREFLARAGALVIGGVSALAMAQSLFPRYVEAQTIMFTDPRIKAKYVEYPSPGGTSSSWAAEIAPSRPHFRSPMHNAAPRYPSVTAKVHLRDAERKTDDASTRRSRSAPFRP